MKYQNIFYLDDNVKESLIKSFSRKQETYDYSCVLFDIPKDIAKKAQEICIENIMDEVLYEIDESHGDDIKYGRETDSHVTIKWGLHTDDPEEVRELLENFPAFEIKLGKISLFESKDTKEEYEVLKIEVIGSDLRRLNKKISETFKVTDTHKEYKPHMTLCYIKKGKCPKVLLGDCKLTGKKIKIKEVLFSDKKGNKTKFKLK